MAVYFLVTNSCLGRDVRGSLPTTVVLKLYTKKKCLHALHLLLFFCQTNRVLYRGVYFLLSWIIPKNSTRVGGQDSCMQIFGRFNHLLVNTATFQELRILRTTIFRRSNPNRLICKQWCFAAYSFKQIEQSIFILNRYHVRYCTQHSPAGAHTTSWLEAFHAAEGQWIAVDQMLPIKVDDLLYLVGGIWKRTIIYVPQAATFNCQGNKYKMCNCISKGYF